ncbi:MAG: DUF2924 domain-containing protein, partial [Deltaproteobacteria bacterium]|nr:DUF2924 domain-containing protein [Deltaproteobacteria bacterium]
PALRAAMEGGYPLHLDATCERGRGGLFVALDGWRGWVLCAGRIPTEHQDHLWPVVEKTVALFGDPLAIVRDMGDGVGAAVEPLRLRGIPDLVCHYHFLAAVGKKLLDRPYALLRDALSRSRVRSDLYVLLRKLRRSLSEEHTEGDFGPGTLREALCALVYWLLHGDGSKDAVFPFGLPHLHFLRRCERAFEQADLWVPKPRTPPERRALSYLRSILERLPRDRGPASEIGRLDEGWQAFCELREVLRLTSAELPRADLRGQPSPLPSLEQLRLAEMQRDLLRYKQELQARVASAGESSVHAVVLHYLERHGSHLFGHPVRRDEDGRIVAVVARTNNTLEHRFGDHKQLLRRRLGRAHLARDLQQQPAQAALVGNLRHPDYVRVLCGSLDELPAALASLDGISVPGTTPLFRDHRDKRLHRQVRGLLEGDAPPKERDTPLSVQGPSPSAVPDISPRITETEGLTEEQLRARCSTVFAPERHPRLPPVGEVLTRTWKGTHHQVRVLERGFEYQAQTYTHLSPIATRISGGRCRSGARFFHLHPRPRPARPKKSDNPHPAAAPFRLGALAPLFRSSLAEAGYSVSRIEVLLGYVQRFATYHARSPEELGEVHVVEFLWSLVGDSKTCLGSYRSARVALSALYRVTLQRPEVVEHIPTRPEPVPNTEAAPKSATNPGKQAARAGPAVAQRVTCEAATVL